MSIISIPAVGYNEVTHENGKVTIQYTNTNAEAIMTVSVGSIGNYVVDGETYNMPYINYLVFKEATIPGVLILSQSIDYETAPAGLFDYNGYSTNTAAIQQSQAAGYSRIAGSTGTLKWRPVNPDYHFDTQEEFDAAFNNGEIVPILPKVYFDVYVNGSDKPSIFVNWTADESLSPILLKPRVWIGADDLFPLANEFVEEGGYKVPNVAAWNIDLEGAQGYGGSYSTTYLSIMGHFEQLLNPVSKVEHWGFDGVPANVRLYLRMDYDNGTTWGDLQRVQIATNGTAGNTQVADSGFSSYDTIVRFHTGEPDYVIPSDEDGYASGTNDDDSGDGRYSEVPDKEFIEDNEGRGFDGNNVLTKTYSVSAATLQNVGQKLWSQSYFDVLKIQNNPIENIISVKAFPFATDGTPEEIKVGDVAFGINGDKIPSVLKKHIGSVKYTGKFGSYLDLNPYTIIKINLPYCGLVQLDASDLFNSTLDVSYIIDMVTGECMAMLTLDTIPYMNVKGQMGIDIPLTSSDRVQTELKTLGASMSVVGGAAGQIMSGNISGGVMSAAAATPALIGTDYNTQRTGSQSPACASFENHGVFLMIERPLAKLADVDSEGYRHMHGLPCHKFKALGELSGFVAIDRRTDIKIAMTSEENAMLESLLVEGVYI